MNKISIVLATYNGQKYILEQLNSINRQTRVVDEVIISDDGSCDNTKIIVLDYIEKNKLTNWYFVDNVLNHGVTNNFINVIKKTTGDIIFLCDQDDVWELNKVERILSCFDDTSVLGVVSRIRYINGCGELINQSTVYTSNSNHYINFCELSCVCSYLGMSSAFRKCVIDNVNEEFMRMTAHDWALMVTACNWGKLIYLGEILQSYRIHGDNASVIKEGTSRNNRLSLICRQMKILEETKKYIENNKEMLSTIILYHDFLCKRYSWIIRKKRLIILFNIARYKRLGYTMRNILADIFASF